MRIGSSQKQPILSTNYNLESLSYIDKFSKSVSPYSPCDQHPYSSLVKTKQEIEATLLEMDILFNSNFSEFIRDENACDRIGPHLAMMCRQYPLYNIVVVCEFITEGWSTLNISKLLTSLTFDWHPDFTGSFMNLYTKQTKMPDQDRLRICVFLLYGEDPETTALFLKSCMLNWSVLHQSAFIQFLEQCLGWDQDFYDEFLLNFMHHFQLKCRLDGFSSVVGHYNLMTLPALSRLKKIFERADTTMDTTAEITDELVSLDIKIYLMICIHKSYTTVVIGEDEINEQQRTKAIAWIGKQPTLVSVESLILEEEDDILADSCVEEPRSFFRQILDRFRL